MLNQSTHSRGANSKASKLRHGPRRWINSACRGRDGFGKSIVVGIADAADRRFDAGLSHPPSVFDRDVLAASVAMVDETAAMNRPPIMECLLQGIEHKAGMRRA